MKKESHMRRWFRSLAGAAAVVLLSSCVTDGAQPTDQASQVVGMRRLTDTQYRNTIADIFGSHIVVNGRFEPIFRPPHGLIATGAANAAISPAGLEQFDSLARGIAAQVFSETNRAGYVACTPAGAAQPDDACARSTLAPLGRFLFRRPLTAEEVSRYTGAAHTAAETTGSFYKGLELALAAMLVSPDFLYIVESAVPDPAHPATLRLDAYSRAARLSFTLWNTTPNQALLDAAARGQLMRQDRLEAIAREMVASPRLADGVGAFMNDMLISERFDDITKDPVIYPLYNSVVGAALTEQLRRTIVDHLVTRNGDYRELFTTRRTFITRALGPAYGVRAASSGWEPLELPADGDRAGLLGQSGFLALYSHPGRPSATLRGRAVREVLLCQAVPDPPGDVDFQVVQDTNNAQFRTARERLDAHANMPACRSCHRLTDPIGLPLEGFDGIGSFRREENGAAIDTSGSLDGVNFTGAAGLGQAIAAHPQTPRCVVRRAIEYATGRPLERGRDIQPAVDAFARDGYQIRGLFFQIVTASEFYSVEDPDHQSQHQASTH